MIKNENYIKITLIANALIFGFVAYQFLQIENFSFTIGLFAVGVLNVGFFYKFFEKPKMQIVLVFLANCLAAFAISYFYYKQHISAPKALIFGLIGVMQAQNAVRYSKVKKD